MLDLETLGVSPGCTILSIGAVVFDPKTMTLGEEFYVVINRFNSGTRGFVEDAETVKWWMEQSEEARAAVFGYPDTRTVREALEAFACFLVAVCPEKENRVVWGNGSAFDNAILAKGYDLVWGFRDSAPWPLDKNNRCYRTVKAMYPEVAIDRSSGTHHKALDDAKAQALHMMKMPLPPATYD